jgi:uncharacterized protein (TIGR02391 family)
VEEDQGDWIRRFLADGVLSGEFAQRTVPNYRWPLEAVLRELGTFDVTTRKLGDWIRSSKYKATTRRHILNVLSVFYDWCNTHHRLDDNPARSVQLPKATEVAGVAMSDEQVRKTLAASDGAMRCWIALAAYQGLKCLDLSLLNAEDLNTCASPPTIRLRGLGSNRSPILHRESVEALEQLHLPASGRLFSDFNNQAISKAISAHLKNLGIRGSADSLANWYRQRSQSGGRDFERSNAGQIVDESVFDVELWTHIRQQFTVGSWDAVITEAAKFVEDRIRKWAGRPADEVGGNLMAAAFGATGALRLGRTASETEGWRLLAIGITLAVRNPSAHHLVKRTDHRTYAAGFLGACSLLLAQIRYEYGGKLG